MAVRHIIERTDDLGSAGAATEIRFSVNGRNYRIDLNKRNRETFERRLSQYISAARVENESSPHSPYVMREWARQNGFEVNDRGRLSIEVEEAYRQAHPDA